MRLARPGRHRGTGGRLVPAGIFGYSLSPLASPSAQWSQRFERAQYEENRGRSPQGWGEVH